MKFLLELQSEEIPARMQAAAAEQLRTRFIEALKAAGLAHGTVTADATPRRLWLIADDVAAASAGSAEEVKGPAATAPAQAIEGFLKKTGLNREQLEERETPKGVVLFAVIRREGRSAADILAEAIPQIVREFAWPKSMRWGEASQFTASPRWVRPLTGIVALLDTDVVACEAHGITSGRETRGHRIHAPESLSITSAATYLEQLRAARVLASSAERRQIIAARAAALAAEAGLSLIPDEGLVAENAGLTEWPVPLLGRFDPAFLSVPREVIVLTMRTNQKYFALSDSAGALAPAFICVANLEASDGGAAITHGNQRVLSARLSDARFFWEQDVAFVKAHGLEGFLPKLNDIVFHEKLGTLADKVERVAALAKWLCESGAVPADPAQAEAAARLAKADLVSATVGEFPELQGQIGRYLALAIGSDPAIADAIRDHYKPAGQGDDVPTAPVSVAVALADKLDTLVGFFRHKIQPTGSKDPFALRRQALALIQIVLNNNIRRGLVHLLAYGASGIFESESKQAREHLEFLSQKVSEAESRVENISREILDSLGLLSSDSAPVRALKLIAGTEQKQNSYVVNASIQTAVEMLPFFADRLKVQQREAGVRHDLIDAVFALGGEDDLVRLLARVKALQAFVETADGTNLLAGYKRAANILKAAEKDGIGKPAAGAGDGAESTLAAALDVALPTATAAVAEERFTDAMAALATLRAPVDAFFEGVMVNDPDPGIRARRLALLARFRDAVHGVADFSKIEG
ncbi:glycine--tRNA ligase subunit beta [Sandarakinorhabdus rubra]|uniref:glycine--tRNA ligase subunit beta n=1 Tax=Sandarakinorhabdus rubra TaxID=2672568 RepID=UPI0013DB2C8F|nr:glycine--tRNA ligase subunit beta [Sandarakinorhabdus rubra]